MDRTSRIIGRTIPNRTDVSDEMVSTIPLWTRIGQELKRSPSSLSKLHQTLKVNTTTLFDNLRQMGSLGLVSLTGTTNRTYSGGHPSMPYVLPGGIEFGTYSGSYTIPPGKQILASEAFNVVKGRTLIPTVGLFMLNTATWSSWKNW